MKITATVESLKSKAVAYVRMSTDHQKYSIDNQMVAIRKYAENNNLSIIEVYSDAGISGLTYEKRDGLKRLLTCVQSEKADFGTILVLDVSRWGRFQDVDESAYYEYMCRRSGIDVHYVAEQFPNDNAPLSAILKAIKRTMAGEYSRELSAKVAASKRYIAEKGFRSDGSTAGYGLRRALIDEHGGFKCILKMHETKIIRGDRIILVPGPKKEIKIVNQIYKYFVEDDLKQTEIVAILNARKIKTDRGRAWTTHVVHEVLTHEKYIGNHIYGKRKHNLGKQANTPKESWGRVLNAFKPIVSDTLFYKAQQKFALKQYRPSNQEMLDALNKLLKRKGRLSFEIVSKAHLPGCSPSALIKRFGSISEAYDLIGYKSGVKRVLYKQKKDVTDFTTNIKDYLVDKFTNANIPISEKSDYWKFLVINNKISVSILICVKRSRKWNRHTRYYWYRCSTLRKHCDYLIYICADKLNTSAEKCYLVPSRELKNDRIQFPRMWSFNVEKYQCNNLENLWSKLHKISIS